LLAILDYLEATRPTLPMAPSDARGRALVDMHMKLCDLQFSRHAGTIINARKVATARGGRWTHVQVRKIMDRASEASGGSPRGHASIGDRLAHTK